MRAQRTLTTTIAVVILAFLALLSTGTRDLRTGVHIVKQGETLAGLAAHYGTTAAALAKANGISNPNRIVAGSRLMIPNAPGRAAAGGTTTYRVRSGDTLGSIASRAGTTIAALVQLNGLGNANLIRVGQELTLPARGSAAPTGSAGYHVVRAGETIAAVAARYGITQQQLIDANGLTGGMIYVGQRLSLAPAAPRPAPPTAPTTHRVAAGETLSDIARHYGTTVRAIQSANGISDPNRVLVGAVLEIPSTARRAGPLRCPVDGAVRFMNDWGFPRSGGRFHEGNDLFAARGTPVVAVVGGNAVQTTGPIGGRQVKLLGDDGTTYYFTHLDTFGAGGRVAAGTVLGTVGSTGNAAGSAPHLHFELHPGGGAAVNPYPSIAAVC